MTLQESFDNINTQDYKSRHPALFAYVREQMAAPHKQYLLIGDTGHLDPALREFLKSPVLAALFNHAALPHICVEMPREIASPERLAAYRARQEAGEIPSDNDRTFWREFQTDLWRWAGNYDVQHYTRELQQLRATIAHIQKMVRQRTIAPAGAQIRFKCLEDRSIEKTQSFYESSLLGFSQAGLRVTAADSWQWIPFLVPSCGERTFLGDREVAAYIDRQAQNEKTAIIYGSSHFWYEGTLASRLGHDKSVHIDFYASRDSYKNALEKYKCHADFMPDRVYLLKEGILEAPDPALYRITSARTDDPDQKLKDNVAQRFGPDAGPAAKAAAIAKIVKLPHIDPQYFNYVP
jgi:hypothetical protein